MGEVPKLFPKEDDFDAVFSRVSLETGVPVPTLKAFVALESAFNERSYLYEPTLNPPDASYGLAQILAGTARGVGFKGKPEELFDPYTSVKYGALFIRALSKPYPCLLDLIAAYNMGSPRKITSTTQRICDIYKYPFSYREQPPTDWTYANEPYVRRVAAYVAYYLAKEKKWEKSLSEIYAQIKARDLLPPMAWLKLRMPEVAFFTGNAVVHVCPACKRPLP